MQPGFQCSKQVENILVLDWVQYLCLGSITDTGIEPITSPAEKAVATTGRHLSTKKEKSERAKI